MKAALFVAITCCLLLRLPTGIGARGNKFATDDDDNWSMVMEVNVEKPTSPIKQQIDTLSGEHNSTHRLDDPSWLRLSNSKGVKCGDRLTCLNAGKCLTMNRHRSGSSSVHRCVCKIGFTGSSCEQVSPGHLYPRIEPGGYLAFKLYNQRQPTRNDSDRVGFNIQFQFLPSEPSSKCLLAYHWSSTGTQGQELMLSMEQGVIILRHIRYSLDHDNGKEEWNTSDLEELRHPRTVGFDNKWIQVEVGIDMKRHLYLIVDGEKKSSTSQFYRRQGQLNRSDNDLIYLAGHPALNVLRTKSPLVRRVDQNCVGCLQHIIINNRPMDPRKKAFVGHVIDGYGIANCAANLCQHSECGDNGRCQPTSGTTYSCQCALGFKGDSCADHETINLPSYKGDSYTVYREFAGTSRSYTSILLSFQPLEGDGLLLYEGHSNDRRGDFVAIYLADAYVNVAFNLGSDTALLTSSNPMSLNKWHIVYFWHRGRQGYLKVDSYQYVQTRHVSGEFVQLTIEKNLYVGGHSNLDLVSHDLETVLTDGNQAIRPTTGFVGCIQQLRINGQEIDLVKQAIDGVNVLNCRSHYCALPGGVCEHGSKCIASAENYQCVCHYGYTGRHCETKELITLNRPVSLKSHSFLEFNSPEVVDRFNDESFDFELSVRPSRDYCSTIDRMRNFSFVHPKQGPHFPEYSHLSLMALHTKSVSGILHVSLLNTCLICLGWTQSIENNKTQWLTCLNVTIAIDAWSLIGLTRLSEFEFEISMNDSSVARAIFPSAQHLMFTKVIFGGVRHHWNSEPFHSFFSKLPLSSAFIGPERDRSMQYACIVKPVINHYPIGDSTTADSGYDLVHCGD